MTLVFAFDTGTRVLSAALAEAEGGAARVLATREERPERGQHSLRLPAVLLDLCRASGRAPEALGAVAVGLGPGSFTGLRVGVAAAKGLAESRRIGIAGCSSLAAMAAETAPLAPLGALLVPVLDARRGQVYAGLYRACGETAEQAGPEAVSDPGALAQALAQREEPIALFGEGAEAYAALFEAALGPRWHHLAGAARTPPAAGVARMCAGALGPYNAEELDRLEPRYLRSLEAVGLLGLGDAGKSSAQRPVGRCD